MSSMDYQPFPQTHWSLVRRAGQPALASRREALAVLLGRYQPALRSYLRFVRKLPADQADDLLQAFIADQLLEQNLIARADESRGKFRTLLLTSLNNFAISRSRQAKLRSAESLPETPAPSAEPGPERVVQAAWARALVHEVIAAMREECRQAKRSDIWLVFEGRILAEIFGTGPVLAYEDLAAQLRLQSPAQAANLLVTAKRMYVRLLRVAVAEYEAVPEDVDAEIAELRGILAAGGALPPEESHG